MKTVSYTQAGKTGKMHVFPVFPDFRIARREAGKTGKTPMGFPRFPAPAAWAGSEA